MARPQKQTVDYFPHDASASQGDTLTILQGKWGNDGYAFWFRLLEKLCSSPGHFIDCRNPVKWQLLLAKSQLSNGTGEEILNTLVDLETIDPVLWKKYKIIWCQNLVDNITDAYRNRRRPVPMRPIPTNINPLTTVSKPQTKLNETKLNEKKTETRRPHHSSPSSKISDLEKNMLDIFLHLNGWDYLVAEDLVWLRELLTDFPALDILDVKGCRDYWSKKPARDKGIWKKRIRNWLMKTRRGSKGNYGRRPAGLPDTEQLANSWKS